jgi:hypothetical protein
MPPWARTWIEHWPAPLAALSFPQQGVALEAAEVRALLAGTPDPALAALVLRLNQAFATLGAPAFVRLGSRSAKDTPLALATGSRAESGAQALALLSAGSRRVSTDLRHARACGLTPYVWLRAWRAIPWWSEFRCFLRGGRVLGISQYHARNLLPPQLAPQLPRIEDRVRTLLAQVAYAWGAAPVVADVTATAAAPATLIELNPWGAATHAGLFAWEREDFDGALRVKLGAESQEPSWLEATAPARIPP